MKVTTAISFGDLAVKRGYVSKEALQEAMLLLAVARRRSAKATLAEVLVNAGWLTPEQARELNHDQQEVLRAAGRSDLPDQVAAAMQLPANRLGKFVKIELIGRGGLGEVWRAYDLVLKRTVALKLLLAVTPDSWQRFVKEAQILGKLQHPNIVPLYEIGDKFLVMPLVNGRTLDQLHLSIPQAAEVLRQTALAIGYAHAQGIVHRDLKPSNIMLEGSTVFVTDFGVSKELQSKESLSTTGNILGTPAYMSPEQVRARTHQIDPRSDIYSLGATLYQLVTGALPFCSEDLFEMLRAIQEDDPRLPSRINPNVPRDLESIILKAMEKLPSKRYRTAEEMAADLERFIKGEPVQARRSGVFSRSVRRMGKHWTAMAFALLAVVGIGFGVYGVTQRPSSSLVQQDSTVGKQQDLTPHQQSDISRNESNRALARGNFEKALESAQKAIASDPNNPLAYGNLAQVYWNMGELDKAKEALDKMSSFGKTWTQQAQSQMQNYYPQPEQQRKK